MQNCMYVSSLVGGYVYRVVLHPYSYTHCYLQILRLKSKVAISEYPLTPGVIARVVRFVPTTYKKWGFANTAGRPGLRVEVYGCAKVNDDQDEGNFVVYYSILG